MRTKMYLLLKQSQINHKKGAKHQWLFIAYKISKKSGQKKNRSLEKVKRKRGNIYYLLLRCRVILWGPTLLCFCIYLKRLSSTIYDTPICSSAPWSFNSPTPPLSISSSSYTTVHEWSCSCYSTAFLNCACKSPSCSNQNLTSTITIQESCGKSRAWSPPLALSHHHHY